MVPPASGAAFTWSRNHRNQEMTTFSSNPCDDSMTQCDPHHIQRRIVASDRHSSNPCEGCDVTRSVQPPPTPTPALDLTHGLFEEFFGLCFGFLDLVSLATCSLVNRVWYQVLQDPYIWMTCYSTSFRHQSDFGGHEHEIHALLSQCNVSQIKRLCSQRLQLQWIVSSRATTWIRPNGNIFMHNDSLLRNFFAGSIESLRSETILQPLGFGLLVGQSLCYFEASFTGCGSIGIVSISCESERLAYGFGSESHIGWFPVSYGYHSDTGAIYWNDGQHSPVGGNDVAYGPAWGMPSFVRRDPHISPGPQIVGCGYEMHTRRLFFTLNGRFIKFADLEIDASRVYAGAVSLHQLDDTADINFGRNVFCFDVETFVLNHLSRTTLSPPRSSTRAA